MSKISSLKFMTTGLGLDDKKIAMAGARRYVLVDFRSGGWKEPFIVQDLVSGDIRNISIKYAKQLFRKEESKWLV